MSLSKQDLKRFTDFEQAYTKGAHHPSIGLIHAEQFHADGDTLVFRRSGQPDNQLPAGCVIFFLALVTIMLAATTYRASGFNSQSLLWIATIADVAIIIAGLVLLIARRLREELRIGPDGIEHIAVRAFYTSRKHVMLNQVMSVAVDRGSDEVPPRVLIYHAGSDRPVRVRIFNELIKCNWMADVIRLRLDELAQLTHKPNAQDLKTHKVIAASVNNPASSRRLFIPSSVTPVRPADTMVQLEDHFQGITLKHDPTSTHIRLITQWLVFSLVVTLLAGLPLLYFVPMGLPIPLEFWQIFVLVVVLFPGIVALMTIRCILRGLGGEVLHINDEQIWHERTRLKNKPPRVAISQVKILGIDDPETGVHCTNDYEGIYDHRVILVFLDHRRVKLTQFPAYSTGEAEYLAGQIIKRFPQMYDVSVLPKSQPEA